MQLFRSSFLYLRSSLVIGRSALNVDREPAGITGKTPGNYRPAARSTTRENPPNPASWWRLPLMDVCLVALFLGLTFLLGAFPLKDTDFYWHLRTGDWIRQTGHVPRTDLFTFTREGVAVDRFALDFPDRRQLGPSAGRSCRAQSGEMRRHVRGDAVAAVGPPSRVAILGDHSGLAPRSSRSRRADVRSARDAHAALSIDFLGGPAPVGSTPATCLAAAPRSSRVGQLARTVCARADRAHLWTDRRRPAIRLLHARAQKVVAYGPGRELLSGAACLVNPYFITGASTRSSWPAR